jgi:hypothetical protein
MDQSASSKDQPKERPALQEKGLEEIPGPSIEPLQEHHLDEMPNDIRQQLSRITLKTKLQDIKSSADLFELLAVAPGAFTKNVLSTSDPVIASLFPGVISYCLERGDSTLLIRILSHPNLFPLNPESFVSPTPALADVQELISLVKTTMAPRGAHFNPGSRKTQDIFLRWFNDKGFMGLCSTTLSRRAGYFGDIDALVEQGLSNRYLALEEAVEHGQLAFVQRFLDDHSMENPEVFAERQSRLRSRLLRIAVVRQDLPMLQYILGYGSSMPKLNVAEAEKPYILLLSSKARDPAFLTFVEQEFYPEVSLWNKGITKGKVNEALKQWATSFDGEETMMWRQGILRWGDASLIKAFMGDELVANQIHRNAVQKKTGPSSPGSNKVQNLLGDYNFILPYLTKHRRDEALVLELLAALNPIEYNGLKLDSILHWAVVDGRLEIGKKVAQIQHSLDPNWSPGVLLSSIRPSTPAKVADWIFGHHKFSQEQILQLTNGIYFPTNGFAFKQLASYQLPDEAYYRLVRSTAQSHTIRGLLLALFGPLSIRLSPVQLRALIGEGLEPMFFPSAKMHALLKKGSLDLPTEDFTALIQGLVVDPRFVEFAEDISVASESRTIAGASSAARDVLESTAARSEHNLGSRLLSIFRNIRP